MNFEHMSSAHFIFIPTVLLIGIVIRAAQDAFAADLKRREERAERDRARSTK